MKGREKKEPSHTQTNAGWIDGQIIVTCRYPRKPNIPPKEKDEAKEKRNRKPRPFARPSTVSFHHCRSAALATAPRQLAASPSPGQGGKRGGGKKKRTDAHKIKTLLSAFVFAGTPESLLTTNATIGKKKKKRKGKGLSVSSQLQQQLKDPPTLVFMVEEEKKRGENKQSPT